MNKLIILLTIFSFWYKSSRSETYTDFIKLKEENGILLFSRWITAPGDRKTREIKATFEVEAEPSVIIDLLKNEQQALLWMRGVKEMKVHPAGDPNEWHVYLLYNIPWPFNKQDCIIRYRVIADSGKEQVQLTLEGTPDYLAVREGIERIPHLSGSWIISKTCTGKCKVEYSVYSFQKPRFPRWATDPLIQNNLIQTMVSLKELAAKTPLKSTT